MSPLHVAKTSVIPLLPQDSGIWGDSKTRQELIRPHLLLLMLFYRFGGVKAQVSVIPGP